MGRGTCHPGHQGYYLRDKKEKDWLRIIFEIRKRKSGEIVAAHTLYHGCGFGIDVGQDMQAFVAHTTKQEGKKRVLRILTETRRIVLPELKQSIVNHPSPRKLNENKLPISNFSCLLFETLRLHGFTRKCRDTAFYCNNSVPGQKQVLNS